MVKQTWHKSPGTATGRWLEQDILKEVGLTVLTAYALASPFLLSYGM